MIEMDNNYGIIYCLTNKINGKKYFGQTIQEIKKYFLKYKNKNNSKQYIFNSIKKYGWGNFNKEIVCYCGDALSLSLIEDLCIVVFNTLAPNGYNLKRGGSHGKASQETRKLMSESRKGEKHWNYGKNRTKETRKLMSDNHADVSGEKNPNYGRVGKLSPHYGKSRLEKTKQLISKKLKKYYKNNPESHKGKNHPQYIHDLDYLTRECLIKEYWVTEYNMIHRILNIHQKSLSEIIKENIYSIATIYRRMKQYNIIRRTLSESSKLRWMKNDI